jgi:DNA-binding XRE family transcriptional regulator
MARVPDEFREDFEAKGESFFDIAELLYAHPNRQYTQNELAEIIDRSNTTVSNHTREMVNNEWLKRQENQTTFTWNSDAHNPASTEGITAVRNFYVDLWRLVNKHLETVPGTFAIMGFALILAALVVFAFFVGFSVKLFEKSAIPPTIYLAIAIGSFLTGVIMTFLSPLQAVVNRAFLRLIPDNIFQKEE